MLRRVFVVQHVHILEDDTEDVKLVGIYSTRLADDREARAGLATLR